MRVEDRLEIYELIAMYAMSYDHNMIDEHVSLFTEDGTLVLTHEATGHNAIRKMTGERRAKIAERGIQNRHFIVNTVLDEVSDNEVDAVSNFMVTWQFEDKAVPEPNFTGVYVDKIVRTNDGWKFKHRRIQIDQKNPRRLSDLF
jgi:3-phenylpropionate/cinnamic acid dioxygenase small subunit